MVKKWLFEFKVIFGKLSVRAALSTIVAVLVSLCAVYLGPIVPDELAQLFGDTSVDSILRIMASSMLVVLTFSLSTMLSAYSSANQVATPRATILIIEDSRSFSAFSILLGAFIYSMVSLIGLSYTYYGAKGRVILMGMTILVLSGVVWVIIKWIEQLKNMGKAHESISRVTAEAMKSFKARENPQNFGCNQFDSPPENGFPLYSNKVGYVQNIDLTSLSERAKELDVDVYVMSDPGDFCHHKKPLMICSKTLNEEEMKSLASSFSIGLERTFSSDPRYGLSVLAGIASKALSPSLNDPGTAVDAATNLVAILTYRCELLDKKVECDPLEKVYLRPLNAKELLFIAFYGLIKDGINQPNLTLALKERLLALTEIGDEDFKSAAQKQLDHLLSRVAQTQTFREDTQILQ